MKREIEIGTRIRDNDPRCSHRRGVVIEIGSGEKHRRVRVDWGPTKTWVHVSRIGKTGKTGYRFEE